MATYDIHKGIVSRSNDPEKRGRIRVKSQTLAGANVELPFWIEPCFPFTSAKSAGWFAVPDVGSVVELEVVISSHTDETFGESFIAHPDVHYRAGLYSAANPPPPELLVNYPRRRGLKTAAGHLLVFDDTKGSELAQLLSAVGTYLKLDEKSNAILKAAHVLLGDPTAVEQLILGTTYRSAEATKDNNMSSALGNLSTHLGTAGTQLSTAGANAAFSGAYSTAAAAIAAAGAALTLAATDATAAKSAVDAFEAMNAQFLSSVSKTK